MTDITSTPPTLIDEPPAVLARIGPPPMALRDAMLVVCTAEALRNLSHAASDTGDTSLTEDCTTAMSRLGDLLKQALTTLATL